MKCLVDKENKIINYTFSDDEWEVILYVLSIYSVLEIEKIMSRFIENRIAQKNANEMEEFHTKFRSLDVVSKQTVLDHIDTVIETNRLGTEILEASKGIL